MDEFDTIVEIISEFLGEPKKVYGKYFTGVLELSSV
jgi:hypothetical protein